MPIRYMAYMPNLADIFVPGTYLAIPYEVAFAFHSVFAYMCKNVSSIKLMQLVTCAS